MELKKVKKWLKWFVSLGLLVFILNYGFETYTRIALEKLVSSMVGLRTLIDEFDIGVINSDIEIEDLFIFNPKNFKDRRIIDVSRIYIDFDFPALFKKQIHFKKLELDLKEFTVVRLADGDLNLQHIKVIKKGKLNPLDIETIIEVGPDFHFDVVDLKIGTVVFIDYSKKAKGKRKEYRLNLHQRMKNVDSIESLYRIILTQTIVKTSLNNILNLNLKSVMKPVRNILLEAVNVTGKVLPTPNKK